MRIDELTVGPVQTRCYVLGKKDGQECIVIDPGDEAKRIRKAAGDRKIAAILLTHGHFDHIGAVRELLNSELCDRCDQKAHKPFDSCNMAAVTQIKDLDSSSTIQNSELSAEAGRDDLSTTGFSQSTRIVIHELDAPMLGNPALNASIGLMGQQITAPEATDLVREGDELDLAGLKVKVLHTPGHTPGSVCYEIEGELFTGDTIFEYGWGRTDLPGGNESDMVASLRRLSSLVRTMPMHAGH